MFTSFGPLCFAIHVTDDGQSAHVQMKRLSVHPAKAILRLDGQREKRAIELPVDCDVEQVIALGMPLGNGNVLRLIRWTPCRREHENCGVQDNDYDEPSQPYNRE
jgi:hypothetical protein